MPRSSNHLKIAFISIKNLSIAATRRRPPPPCQVPLLPHHLAFLCLGIIDWTWGHVNIMTISTISKAWHVTMSPCVTVSIMVMTKAITMPVLGLDQACECMGVNSFLTKKTHLRRFWTGWADDDDRDYYERETCTIANVVKLIVGSVLWLHNHRIVIKFTQVTHRCHNFRDGPMLSDCWPWTNLLRAVSRSKSGTWCRWTMIKLFSAQSFEKVSWLLCISGDWAPVPEGLHLTPAKGTCTVRLEF